MAGMEDEKKKAKKIAASRTVQELYLYPNRSYVENFIRGFIWIISWIGGIATQDFIEIKPFGGAYFIFVLSIFAEFLLMEKTLLLPKIYDALFKLLLGFLLIGAITILVSEKSSNLLLQAMSVAGILVFIMLCLSWFLGLIRAHTFFYNEKTNQPQKKEAEQQEVRDQFMTNLIGPDKGGKPQ